MKAFTHDLETVPLTEHETAAFGRLVRESCFVYEQHQVSKILEGTSTPWDDITVRFALRQVSKVWRSELSRGPQGGEAC